MYLVKNNPLRCDGWLSDLSYTHYTIFYIILLAFFLCFCSLLIHSLSLTFPFSNSLLAFQPYFYQWIFPLLLSLAP